MSTDVSAFANAAPLPASRSVSAEPEVTIPAGSLPLTAQDADNRFIYANDSYLALSGYTWEEMQGQPGVMMQHPDLPPQVRDDIRRSIAAGVPWTGLVKNRRKDGGCYWACACLAPMFRNGRLTGTMMVRRTPSREQVREAQAAYRRMRDQPRSGLDIRGGRIVRTGLAGRLWGCLQTRLGWRVGVAIGLVDVGLVATAWATDAIVPSLALPALLTLAALTAFIAPVIRNGFLDPLRSLLAAANRMAGGDLDVDLRHPGRDEFAALATALNQSRLTLRATVHDIREAMKRFDEAALGVASDSGAVSARTETQAANLQQTAASVDLLAKTVGGNAQAASQVEAIASQAADAARAGGERMNEVTTQMSRIAQTAKDIEAVIGAIREIAAKTNILALNAAVEAARAAERGAGFAVVAAEVRALAQQTDSLAKDASALVATSACDIHTGSALVDAAGATMHDIVTRAESVKTLVSRISTASAAQSREIAQVNEALSQLDRMTQQNAALVESTRSAASGLQARVRRLNDAVALLDAGH